MTDTAGALQNPGLLDEVGFLIVPGAPLTSGPSYLFVALRPKPTLRHFDPERIGFWVSGTHHGHATELSWLTHDPPVCDYAPGQIRIIDGRNVTNDFASFGGTLLTARLREVKVCVFRSEAPILAADGRSQPWDPGARESLAFLAGLRGNTDPAELEAEVERLSPMVRYAAFVHDSLLRGHNATPEMNWPADTAHFFEGERNRLRREAEVDWASGVNLAERSASWRAS
jgi:hypothetical protein